eukprot:CAMPEP_0201556612 /NCGR_PEP_ID=MMETSP0173_2-20130828/56618_1 /ASSEMBLY_ACC=CAM_ASM_000268 /TAXON_ID=218659 /ORGANISM="Vexillifera sp., Strain DIVA3 564/2" /LENGTH=114 /DNA_ID=CAMNT_0047968989 /DNA_START=275 /DNA_END=619 /DNA_ORIENTATION=+
MSRQWYIPADEWLRHEGHESRKLETTVTPFFVANKKEEQPKKVLKCPANDAQKECAICDEPFETLWDNKTEEWMFSDAMVTNTGQICHPSCWTSQLQPEQSLVNNNEATKTEVS